MTAPVVELEHVHRSFGGGIRFRSLARGRVQRRPQRQVLNDVSFHVEPGEWLALMGTNGSGKTTILKMVAGLVRADAGTVRVNGLDVRKNGTATRRVVGYSLADERSFQWRLTARENLRFFATLEGLTGTERSTRVTSLLDAMDLNAQADRPFGEFSTGIRQRLAIARALLMRPRILLLDEPTRSLDTQHAADVWRVIQEEMAAVGGSVLVATHRSEEAAEYCQRLWLLKDGILREQTSHLLHRGAFPEQGFSIIVRGLAPTAVDLLRVTDGIHSVEPITVAAGDSIFEVRTDGEDGAVNGLLRLLAQHGGTVEAVHEEVLAARAARPSTPRTAEVAS